MGCCACIPCGERGCMMGWLRALLHREFARGSDYHTYEYTHTHTCTYLVRKEEGNTCPCNVTRVCVCFQNFFSGGCFSHTHFSRYACVTPLLSLGRIVVIHNLGCVSRGSGATDVVECRDITGAPAHGNVMSRHVTLCHVMSRKCRIMSHIVTKSAAMSRAASQLSLDRVVIASNACAAPPPPPSTPPPAA